MTVTRLFLLTSIFLPAFAMAQTEFGLKGGLNISDIVITNYINPDVESDFRLKVGWHGGLFVSGMVHERLGAAVELLYSDKGVNGNSDIHLHYVNLPVMIHYTLTDNILAEAGPELGYMVAATSRHGNVSSTYNQKLDLGLAGGFRYDMGKVFLGLRYCAGVFSVTEPVENLGSSGVEKIKYQNRVLQFSLGYKLFTLE